MTSAGPLLQSMWLWLTILKTYNLLQLRGDKGHFFRFEYFYPILIKILLIQLMKAHLCIYIAGGEGSSITAKVPVFYCLMKKIQIPQFFTKSI